MAHRGCSVPLRPAISRFGRAVETRATRLPMGCSNRRTAPDYEDFRPSFGGHARRCFPARLRRFPRRHSVLRRSQAGRLGALTRLSRLVPPETGVFVFYTCGVFGRFCRPNRGLTSPETASIVFSDVESDYEFRGSGSTHDPLRYLEESIRRYSHQIVPPTRSLEPVLLSPHLTGRSAASLSVILLLRSPPSPLRPYLYIDSTSNRFIDSFCDVDASGVSIADFQWR